MIRFKVVQKDTQCSAFAQGKFRHTYDKNVVIEPGYLGVMVFDTEKNARKFIGLIAPFRGQYKVIKVKVYGRATKPKWISAQFNLHAVMYFYKKHVWLLKGTIYKMSPPKGTLCYKKVMAIE